MAWQGRPGSILAKDFIPVVWPFFFPIGLFNCHTPAPSQFRAVLRQTYEGANGGIQLSVNF